MSSKWWIRRDVRDHGPYPQQQFQSIVDSGRLLPTDQVRQGADGEWVAAGDWLARNRAPIVEEVPMADAVAERTLQTTCLVCYGEFPATVAPGTSTVACPSCNSPVEVVGDPEAGSIEQAFTGLEDPTERVRRRVQEAYAAEAEANGVFGKILQGSLKEVAKEVAKGLIQ